RNLTNLRGFLPVELVVPDHLVVLVLVGRVRGVRRRGLLGRLRRLTGRRGGRVVVRRLRLVVLASTRGVDDDGRVAEHAVVRPCGLNGLDERRAAVRVAVEHEAGLPRLVEGDLDDLLRV